MESVVLCTTMPLALALTKHVATLKLGHVVIESMFSLPISRCIANRTPRRDCTPSLCYKGAGNCFLRVIVSTNGICGLVKDRHTLRVCGEWGDCCNLQNRCGSGPDFCGKGVCQAGECTHSDWPMDERPEQLPWEYGEGDP